MLYDRYMLMHFSEIITIDGSKYIAATFNATIQKAVLSYILFKKVTLIELLLFFKNL
jgi:hypothetical protein